MAFSVFLSHSNHDYDFMFAVSRQLQSVGIKSYLYQYDQQPGRPIIDKIEEGIDASDALVTLLTQSGAQSGYVQHEISYARAKKKVIVPLLAPGISLPAILAGREYIPLNPATAMLNLQTYLQKLSIQKSNEEMKIALAIIVGVIGVAYLASHSSAGVPA